MSAQFKPGDRVQLTEYGTWSGVVIGPHPKDPQRYVVFWDNWDLMWNDAKRLELISDPPKPREIYIPDGSACFHDTYERAFNSRRLDVGGVRIRKFREVIV